MNRKIIDKVQGFRTKDGAGVSLVRVLSNQTVMTYDPILMLDSFDSTDPDDYIAGFPFHPHRGIETISYLVKGKMIHADSMGNTDAISDGEVQWMTAGSGIMHEEKLPPAERMLGVQLWLNLAKKDKMTHPKYHAIKHDDIQKIDIGVGTLNLLVGNYKDASGYQAEYQPLDYYDIELRPNVTFELDVDPDKSIMLFTLLGKVKVGGEEVAEKTAVKLSEGDRIVIESMDEATHLLFMSSDRLREPIAWGGPIVMNTRDALMNAFDELENGTFIKEGIDYHDNN
ncbi:pirin family protein [Peptoniphilus equinus]|uniref:Pirin family protein n=1 Tax=Peptoniphilus equinus TaxID=3016343 RepID=A0ABY7QWA6_9FIRM|nr:pirin family protein [Peptoniphilus equinus]WBW50498.1 pirin family protein [Peptoniphilus equinus]